MIFRYARYTEDKISG